MYENIFLTATEPSIVVDIKTKDVVAVNFSLQDMLNKNTENFKNIKIDDFVFIRAFGNLPITKQELFEDSYYEDIFLEFKNQKYTDLDLKVRIITDAVNNKRYSVLLIRDVSERKRLESDLIKKHKALVEAHSQLKKIHTEAESFREQLIQSGKLAALGVLAAGIAHELNQPLTGIKGFSQEILFDIKRGILDEKSINDYAQEIVKNVDRMKTIIQHLREFVRKRTESFVATNVVEILNNAFILLKEQLRSHGIQIIQDYDDELPLILSNPNELEQVFINFLTNARDALDAKDTSNSDKTIIISVKKIDSKIIQVVFKDNGIGMDAQTKNKMFEPFFTTKEVGKGMGLGLSITYSILERLGATIIVESEPLKGCTIKINLQSSIQPNQTTQSDGGVKPNQTE